VVDVAVPPDKRSFPKRTITVFVVMLIGLFLACGWSLAAEGLQRLKSDPAEHQRIDALRATFR
jgi:tyrosine-protein kinase Etk/Wzc